MRRGLHVPGKACAHRKTYAALFAVVLPLVALLPPVRPVRGQLRACASLFTMCFGPLPPPAYTQTAVVVHRVRHTTVS